MIDLLKGTFNSGGDTMFAGLDRGQQRRDHHRHHQQEGRPLDDGRASELCRSGHDWPTGPDIGFQAMAALGTGINGVTIENMNLIGAAVAGGACPAYQAGVINSDSTR